MMNAYMADEALKTGLVGGVENRALKLVAYDPDWPQKFETHAKLILSMFGSSVLQIEHIGSTSVPGSASS